MKYHTIEGKTYCVVGTAEGTVTSASGVVIASFSANEQSYFTAPAGGFVTISDDTAIVTPVFDLAPSALVGKSSGGDSPSGANSDFVGYIEYDDETGAIVDMSIPKYTTGNLSFRDAVFSDDLRDWKIDMPYLTNGSSMFRECTNLTSFSADLSSLSNSHDMFFQCENLTSFSADLSSLTNGTQMFYDCKLDAASVERILSTIPTYTDGSTHELQIHFSSEAAAKFEEITGVTPTTSQQTVSYKGWTIYAMINR